MKALSLLALIALIAAAFGAGYTSADTAQVIGRVVSTQGTWCDQAHLKCEANDSQTVGQMYAVQANSKLVRVGEVSGRETIVIRSRWGEPVTFDCSNPRELGCQNSLNLSPLMPAEPHQNVYTSFFDAVTQLASDQPKVYDSLRQGILRTRGPGSRLADGVVQLRDGGLRFENVLVKYGAGDFLLELCPLGNTGEPACPPQPAPVKYSWDPAHPAPFPAAGVQPGLYRLYQCEDRQGGVERTPFFADLLIAAEPHYAQLSADYQHVLDATRDWDSSDPTAPAMRRAYLYELARR
jgi:hypothetical protein